MALLNINNVIAHCTCYRQFQYVLEWVAERHYISGTVFEMRSHRFNTFFSWKHVRIEMERADITYRWKVDPSASEIRANPDRIVFKAKLTYGVRQGEKVRIRLWLIPPFYAGLHETLSVWLTCPKDAFAKQDAPAPLVEKEENSECTLSVIAGPVERFSVHSRPMPAENSKIRVVLIPEDRFGNPSEFRKSIKLALDWEGKRWEMEVKAPETIYLDPLQKTARLKVSIDVSCLPQEDNIINGLHENGKIIITGNPVWVDQVDNYKAAFGEFHWHTDASADGSRSILDALTCARDFLNMDFAAPGDHNTQGKAWENTVKTLDAFEHPGYFATFYGWENGTNQGHENYYFTDPDHPLKCGGKAGIIANHPTKLIETLKKYCDFIAIPHHTNAVSETRKLDDDSPYWHPYPWTSPVDYIRLVEIMQARGNQERNDYTDDWRAWYQNYGSSVQDALALGYQVGFTGGTDNHSGWPGRAFNGQSAEYSHKSIILTGIWTEEVERQKIYNALYDRHTWAVWDTRALVVFKVNGTLMGGLMRVIKGEKLEATIRMSAEDSYKSVEIVSEGKTVWSSTFADLDIEAIIPLEQAKKNTHFYMRALLRNGGIIYASPVFVEVEE